MQWSWSKRSVSRALLVAGVGAAVAIGVACTSTPPQPTPAPQAAPTLRAPASLPTTAAAAPPASAQASPVVGAPAVGTRTAPTGTQAAGSTRATVAPSGPGPAAASACEQPEMGPRGEPKGTLNYVWHTSISPAWLDPQENPPQITPYNFAYAIHDALVKPLPGHPFAASLAESCQISSDFKTATFKLRQGIKFHNGDPVTPEDVKFTFEKYRGANAKILHDMTQSVDVVDDRTVRFTFKQPFPDFMTIYGTPASGAGWIVPKKYYEQVGPNGFKQHPIGAGPYKFVKQAAGSELDLEAFTDYWRKTPNIKTIIMKGVSEGSTRVALLKTGEADQSNLIPGELIASVQSDPNLKIAAVKSGPIWVEFSGYQDASSPFNDPKVRQAVSLALDRKAINDAEQGGLGPLEGNWIPEDWPGAIQRPTPPMDVNKAKQLMAEAGKADGFDTEITPLPNYFSMAERISSQLRAINIRAKVNTMERGAFYQQMAKGANRKKGLIMWIAGQPGDAADRIRSYAMCDGAFSGTCDQKIEDMMKQYSATTNPQERNKIIADVQTYVLDNYIMVPVMRQALIHGLGPRLWGANKIEDIDGSIPQYVYIGPYEDVKLKQ